MKSTGFERGSMGKRTYVPFLLFGGVLILLVGIYSLGTLKPRITSIDPKIGQSGQTLTIEGWGFGKDRVRISIGSITPTSSAYEEWTPKRIRVKIPEEVSSGLVYVYNKNGRSNPVLFTNRQDIPVLAQEEKVLGFPEITSIDREQGRVGDLITITGRNFGANRGNGIVYFSWAGSSSTTGSSDMRGVYLPASEVDMDYEGWSDTEIRVRVPTGAGTGNLFVLCEKGKSNAVYFEVDGSSGSYLFKEKRTYTVRSSMNIHSVAGGENGGLYLWIPRVQEGPNQRDVQMIEQEPKAEIENYNGLLLVFLRNLVPNRTYTVSQTFLLDRYEIETKLNPQKIKLEYDKGRDLYKVYTAENSVTPVTHPEITKTVSGIVGKEKNPYLKALKIYSFLVEKLKYDSTQRHRSVVEGLSERGGNAYTFALLFVSLARNTGVPARTIAGYLITDTKAAIPHFWCEIYLEGVGWIEVDPALGTAPLLEGFRLAPDPKSYYFGNMDNRRVAFSRGLVQAKRISPHGRTMEQPEIHSLQTIYAEAVGDIRSFSGTWNTLEVIGVY